MGIEWGVNKHEAEINIDNNATLPAWFPDTMYIDVETTGLATTDKLLGIGFTFTGRDCYYSTYPHTLKALIESKKLVGHNIKFDYKVLLANGFNIKPEQIAGDTMLMSYCLNSTKETHGLKPLAKELLGMEWPSYEDLTTKTEVVPRKPTKKYPATTKTVTTSLTLDQLPLDVVANYNGMDVLATYRLHQHFKDIVGPWYYDVELPLLRLLIQMELNGMSIDVDYFRQLYTKYNLELEGMREGLKAMSKPYIEHFMQLPDHLLQRDEYHTAKKAWKENDFNPGSSQQKLTMLHFMGINVESSDKKVLVKQKNLEPIKALLDYSEVASINNKFLKRLITAEDKVSTTYNQVRSPKNVFDDEQMIGIRSGRLSSSSKASPTDLNLQQIPSRSEKGKQIRNGFISPPGFKFVSYDYSMIELRLIAHFSQEPTFIKAFNEGLDLHQLVADELGVERYAAKQGNFLVSYGGGPRKLADTLNIPYGKAKQFFDAYWRKYYVIQEWKQKVVEDVRRVGSITTLCGREIRIPEINSYDFKSSGRAERQAVSYLVQGSAAEIIKKAMLACRTENYIPRLTVHDELGFYLADNGQLVYTVSKIKHIMETVVKLTVPLTVESGIANSWGEAKA